MPVGSRNFVPRPVAVGTADGEKDHEGSAPSNSAAGESHLHLGKQVCRLYKNSMVQVLCICRSPAVQAGRRRRNPPPERFNPLSGENLIHQVRELRRNPLWSCAMPVGSRNFVPRPLAVEPPTGGKTMRAPRPQTPRQVRVTCTSANKFAVFIRYSGAGALHLLRSCVEMLVVLYTKSSHQSRKRRDVRSYTCNG